MFRPVLPLLLGILLVALGCGVFPVNAAFVTDCDDTLEPATVGSQINLHDNLEWKSQTDSSIHRKPATHDTIVITPSADVLHTVGHDMDIAGMEFVAGAGDVYLDSGAELSIGMPPTCNGPFHKKITVKFTTADIAALGITYDEYIDALPSLFAFDSELGAVAGDFRVWDVTYPVFDAEGNGPFYEATIVSNKDFTDELMFHVRSTNLTYDGFPGPAAAYAETVYTDSVIEPVNNFEPFEVRISGFDKLVYPTLQDYIDALPGLLAADADGVYGDITAANFTVLDVVHNAPGDETSGWTFYISSNYEGAREVVESVMQSETGNLYNSAEDVALITETIYHTNMTISLPNAMYTDINDFLANYATDLAAATSSTSDSAEYITVGPSYKDNGDGTYSVVVTSHMEPLIQNNAELLAADYFGPDLNIEFDNSLDFTLNLAQAGLTMEDLDADIIDVLLNTGLIVGFGSDLIGEPGLDKTDIDVISWVDNGDGTVTFVLGTDDDVLLETVEQTVHDLAIDGMYLNLDYETPIFISLAESGYDTVEDLLADLDNVIAGATPTTSDDSTDASVVYYTTFVDEWGDTIVTVTLGSDDPVVIQEAEDALATNEVVGTYRNYTYTFEMTMDLETSGYATIQDLVDNMATDIAALTSTTTDSYLDYGVLQYWEVPEGSGVYLFSMGTNDLDLRNDAFDLVQTEALDGVQPFFDQTVNLQVSAAELAASGLSVEDFILSLQHQLADAANDGSTYMDFGVVQYSVDPVTGELNIEFGSLEEDLLRNLIDAISNDDSTANYENGEGSFEVDVMPDLVRTVTVDLEAIGDANYDTIEEYLAWLVPTGLALSANVDPSELDVFVLSYSQNPDGTWEIELGTDNAEQDAAYALAIQLGEFGNPNLTGEDVPWGTNSVTYAVANDLPPPSNADATSTTTEDGIATTGTTGGIAQMSYPATHEVTVAPDSDGMFISPVTGDPVTAEEYVSDFATTVLEAVVNADLNQYVESVPGVVAVQDGAVTSEGVTSAVIVVDLDAQSTYNNINDLVSDLIDTMNAELLAAHPEYAGNEEALFTAESVVYDPATGIYLVSVTDEGGYVAGGPGYPGSGIDQTSYGVENWYIDPDTDELVMVMGGEEEDVLNAALQELNDGPSDLAASTTVALEYSTVVTVDLESNPNYNDIEEYAADLLAALNENLLASAPELEGDSSAFFNVVDIKLNEDGTYDVTIGSNTRDTATAVVEVLTSDALTGKDSALAEGGALEVSMPYQSEFIVDLDETSFNDMDAFLDDLLKQLAADESVLGAEGENPDAYVGVVEYYENPDGTYTVVLGSDSQDTADALKEAIASDPELQDSMESAVQTESGYAYELEIAFNLEESVFSNEADIFKMLPGVLKNVSVTSEDTRDDFTVISVQEDPENPGSYVVVVGTDNQEVHNDLLLAFAAMDPAGQETGGATGEHGGGANGAPVDTVTQYLGESATIETQTPPGWDEQPVSQSGEPLDGQNNKPICMIFDVYDAISVGGNEATAAAALNSYAAGFAQKCEMFTNYSIVHTDIIMTSYDLLEASPPKGASLEFDVYDAYKAGLLLDANERPFPWGADDKVPKTTDDVLARFCKIAIEFLFPKGTSLEEIQTLMLEQLANATKFENDTRDDFQILALEVLENGQIVVVVGADSPEIVGSTLQAIGMHDTVLLGYNATTVAPNVDLQGEHVSEVTIAGLDPDMTVDEVIEAFLTDLAAQTGRSVDEYRVLAVLPNGNGGFTIVFESETDKAQKESEKVLSREGATVGGGRIVAFAPNARDNPDSNLLNLKGDNREPSGGLTAAEMSYLIVGVCVGILFLLVLIGWYFIHKRVRDYNQEKANEFRREMRLKQAQYEEEQRRLAAKGSISVMLQNESVSDSDSSDSSLGATDLGGSIHLNNTHKFTKQRQAPELQFSSSEATFSDFSSDPDNMSTLPGYLVDGGIPHSRPNSIPQLAPIRPDMRRSTGDRSSMYLESARRKKSRSRKNSRKSTGRKNSRKSSARSRRNTEDDDGYSLRDAAGHSKFSVVIHDEEKNHFRTDEESDGQFSGRKKNSKKRSVSPKKKNAEDNIWHHMKDSTPEVRRQVARMMMRQSGSDPRKMQVGMLHAKPPKNKTPRRKSSSIRRSLERNMDFSSSESSGSSSHSVATDISDHEVQAILDEALQQGDSYSSEDPQPPRATPQSHKKKKSKVKKTFIERQSTFNVAEALGLSSGNDEEEE